MKNFIRIGSNEYELINRINAPVDSHFKRFDSLASAIDFLSRCMYDYLNMIQIRSFLRGHFYGNLSCLSDSEAIKELARQLISGSVIIVQRDLFRGIPSGAGSSASYPAGASSSADEFAQEAEKSIKEEKEYSVSQPAAAAVSKEKEEQKSWIEIELVDEKLKGVPDHMCTIILPDGREKKTKTDNNGLIRLEEIMPGMCKVTFTQMDKTGWDRI